MLYLSNYNDFRWFVKYFEIHKRKEEKISPVEMVKLSPRFSYSSPVWHAKKLHRFNDFSCGSVKVIEELICRFSARSGKINLTRQLYTTQIKLLI